MGSTICHLIGLDAHKPNSYVKNSGKSFFGENLVESFKTAVTSLLLPKLNIGICRDKGGILRNI